MPQLKIFKASAGSGKTYRLVAEYIKLLIEDPGKYKHILAVTFTNKATTEMKVKLLNSLSSLSTGRNNGLEQLILDETNFSKNQIKENSGIALSQILHDYDKFSVTTIDSFFQGVLRSFAREIGSFGAFEVDLNKAEMLEEACDRMIQTVDSDEELRDWLLMMAEEQLEDSKSWQIKRNILNFGNELSKDTFQMYVQSMESLDDERLKLKKLKNNLYKTRNWYESECSRIGKEGLDLISGCGLEISDFKYGSTSFPKYFESLKETNTEKFIPSVRVLDSLDSPDSWCTLKSEKRKEILHCYDNGLNSKLKEALLFFTEYYSKYLTAKVISKNLNMLGVLSTLAFNLRELQKEKNTILLDESDKLLNVIIGTNDAPFIYENYGTYYNNFMIDEFQDTSAIQWENFKPLVMNSLSENNDNIVVGDIKQSIYRWRNSDWKLLESKLESDLNRYKIEKVNLDKNWRSFQEIVKFNNDFFNAAKDILDNSIIQEIDDLKLASLNDFYSGTIKEVFSDINQEYSQNKDGGFIKIKRLLIPENKEADFDYEEETLEKIVEEIQNIQDKGFKASDIAILVKLNNNGSKIANYLLRKKKSQTKYNFEVVSDDSMYLGNSTSSIFLVGMIKCVVSPFDDVIKASVAFEYYTRLFPLLGIENVNYAYKSIDKTTSLEIVENFTPEGFIDDYFPFFNEGKEGYLKELSSLSLIDLVNKIENDFRLNEIQEEQANIQAFNDSVFDFTKRESNNIKKFIEWWDIFGGKIKIQGNSQKDAIRILSIHKSKGLEFPFVIIPFCDWDLGFSRNGDIIWCPAPEQYSNDFPILPVNVIKDLIRTDFSGNYLNELLMHYIDNINLLYVAFTRAVEGLIVFTELKEKKSDKKPKFKDISDLISKTIFTDDNANDNEEQTFVIGELRSNLSQDLETKNGIHIKGTHGIYENSSELMLLHKNYENFLDDEGAARYKKINEGKIIHDILSKTEILDDLEFAVRKVFQEGKILKDDVDLYTQRLQTLLSSPDVMHWFEGKYKVINEATIIDQADGFKRPDRVMIKDDEVIIVDYKLSSIMNNAHTKQVATYLKKVQQMGFAKVKGFLWYLDDNKIVEVKAS